MARRLKLKSRLLLCSLGHCLVQGIIRKVDDGGGLVLRFGLGLRRDGGKFFEYRRGYRLLVALKLSYCNVNGLVKVSAQILDLFPKHSIECLGIDGSFVKKGLDIKFLLYYL